MSTSIQRRRGTTAQHSSFTGANGEITIDTDKEVVVVHDGATAGGYPGMRENGSNSALAIGSAASPSLKFTGDTNTGLYSPGADQVAISTNGSGRVFVNNTGLGVGIAASRSIDVYRSDAAGSAILRLSDVDSRNVELRSPDGLGNTAGVGSVTNHDFTFFINNTERMRISSSGFVGIGTPSALNIETGLAVKADQGNGGAGVAHIRNSLASGADASPCLVLSKTATTTSSSARFIQFSASDNATPMGGIVGNGASNVQFATLSDIRDKENIQPLAGSLSKIKQVEVVAYDWKASGEHVNAGFIAQNIETIFPEYVVENMTGEGDDARKGITGGLSSGYVAVLTAALQEAIAKIETLEAKVAAIEGA